MGDEGEHSSPVNFVGDGVLDIPSANIKFTNTCGYP